MLVDASLANNPAHMAIRSLGLGFGRADEECPRGVHSFTCRGRQVHQVDKGLPNSKIGSEEVVEFFLDIIHRFGVPKSKITNNNTQFRGKKFLKFYDDYHI